MYKSYTANQFQSLLDLPENYSVNGLLSYGAWDEQRYFEKLLTILRELDIKHSSKQLTGFLSRVYEIKIEEKLYWFTPLYGGAMLSEYVHLACLFGSRKNIHIGSCGGLYPKMESLDFLIPDWSYGNDSTTRTYARDSKDNRHYSDKKLSQSLRKEIKSSKQIWEGPVITCQAMMGETQEDIQNWSKDGFYGVEMETAAIFSVSKHFNVPSAALLYVSDNLIRSQAVGSENHTKQKEKREMVTNEIYKTGLITLIQDVE